MVKTSSVACRHNEKGRDQRSRNGGTPIAGSFIIDKPIRMDDFLGYSLF